MTTIVPRTTRMLALAVFVLGCASGGATYTPPVSIPMQSNTVTIQRSRSDLWRALVPAIGRTFFVINNLDQSSGLINVSFSGNPEAYLDCGRIVSRVKYGNEERTYDFPASRAEQRYAMVMGTGARAVDRTLALEGRVNVILEEVSGTVTRVTVNVRYVLTRHIRVEGPPATDSMDSISFTSGGRASFAGADVGTTCQATGTLEKELLALVGSP